MAITRPWICHVPLAATLTACRYSGFLCAPRLDLVRIFLANRDKHRKFLRHIATGKGILHGLGQPHPQCISKARKIPVPIGSNNLKLSIILGELTVLVLNFLHFPCNNSYSIMVPKCCFQELYNIWQVFQLDRSILWDVWQDLTHAN
jgi:hypothetical protein